MRKRDILGGFVNRPDVICSHTIKKLDGEALVFSALINFLPGTKELHIINYEGKELCLAAAGYKWLCYLPINEYWRMEAFYNTDNELIEWYFDISRKNFLYASH